MGKDEEGRGRRLDEWKGGIGVLKQGCLMVCGCWFYFFHLNDLIYSFFFANGPHIVLFF